MYTRRELHSHLDRRLVLNRITVLQLVVLLRAFTSMYKQYGSQPRRLPRLFISRISYIYIFIFIFIFIFIYVYALIDNVYL